MQSRVAASRIKTFCAAILLITQAALHAQELGPKDEPAAMGSDYQPLLWRDKDAQFALDASRAATCQIAADQLVGSRSSDEQVLATAAHSISFEERLNKRLRSMAKTIGFQLGSKKYPAECAEADHLRTLTGDAFERAYTAALLKNRRESQARFTAEAGAAPDSANYELRKFATQQMINLRENKGEIDALAQRYSSTLQNKP